MIVLAAVLAAVMAASWYGMRRAATGGAAEAGLSPRSGSVPHDEERGRFASMVIPEFELVDQDGRARTRDIFRGASTILAFTFTHCPTACPIIHSNLVRLQEALRGTPVRIVSITVDPAHDTPEALKAHAQRLSADPARWSFLTGDEGTIRRIIDGLRFGIEEDPSITITLADGSTMNNIIHTTKLLLIGPDATVRAMESGLEWSAAERLGAEARRLAASLDSN